ncbi:MAG: hypothetical protein FIB08_16985 [Candidatus Methanoperedens sp.]|nr:hypothetical protein [Candidatus Methanoperedens sp.]
MTIIDVAYKWGDIQIIHDGYELSRFEKTKYIVKYYKKMPVLRVCYSQFFENNCGYCEKCMRTIFDLALSGADPKECNFNINKNIFKYIKNCFIKKRLRWSAGIRSFWEDSQEHIPKNIEMLDSSCSPEFQNELKEFCIWFKDFDLSEYGMNTNKNFWDKHFSWRLYYFIYHGKILSTFKRITTDKIKFKILYHLGIGAYIKKVLYPLNIKKIIQQIK